MDHPHEKRTKAGHDGVRTSKRGRKSIVGLRAPPQDSPPSGHQEDEEPEALKMHEPKEIGNRVYIKYSKKTSLTTLIEHREALVYSGWRMCTDQCFGPSSTPIGTGWCTS
jgi:hypothetical protein